MPASHEQASVFIVGRKVKLQTCAEIPVRWGFAPLLTAAPRGYTPTCTPRGKGIDISTSGKGGKQVGNRDGSRFWALVFKPKALGVIWKTLRGSG